LIPWPAGRFGCSATRLSAPQKTQTADDQLQHRNLVVRLGWKIYDSVCVGGPGHATSGGDLPCHTHEYKYWAMHGFAHGKDVYVALEVIRNRPDIYMVWCGGRSAQSGVSESAKLQNATTSVRLGRLKSHRDRCTDVVPAPDSSLCGHTMWAHGE
jgi:hypothetical protein